MEESSHITVPNLRFLISRKRRLLELLLSALAGLAVSFTFSPLELTWLAWFALIPLLALPVPMVRKRRVVIGFIFGAAYFVPSLFWLNEVGFGAGILLAVICALFPMTWYLIFCTATVNFLVDRGTKNADANIFPAIACLHGRSMRFAVSAFGLSALWVGLEWVRSWLFTGFPWNFLGVSQWQNLGLLRITTFTGVYGISFLIVLANFTLAWIFARWYKQFRRGHYTRKGEHWPVITALICFALALLAIYRAPELPEMADDTLVIAGIQGNLSQRREWSEEQLEEAIEVYDSLTRQALTDTEEDIDLVVWPETAIPAAVQWEERSKRMLQRLFAEFDIPFLLGSIDYRPASDSEDDYAQVNSAIYFGPDGQVRDRYDKTHLVPFGEFVPLGDKLPWLRELIGMGRDLRAGQQYTVINLPGEAEAGVNICYEDVFPYISRKFTRRGANLLITLTNDAWYAKSSGSRQHMIHAVFRAAETRLPLFRSGNNSDTCLILPDGRVQGLLYEESGNDRFVRGFHVYKVPIWKNPPTTFYVQYGD
ncbi:MAG: apolipoprotein N-acyltransferase, partial [Lentisphaeria bacterium]